MIHLPFRLQAEFDGFVLILRFAQKIFACLGCVTGLLEEHDVTVKTAPNMYTQIRENKN